MDRKTIRCERCGNGVTIDFDKGNLARCRACLNIIEYIDYEIPSNEAKPKLPYKVKTNGKLGLFSKWKRN